LAVALLAGVAWIGPPQAQAADGAPAPAASGWYITGREDGGGLEVLSIHRDSPAGRGKVVVLPRSGLYRLRTVLASEQLIGGTRSGPTTLCARVHCHAAVNGDRWDLIGHDAGRLTGAVAIDGELIATQPIPPADPYAHLLMGRDGSLAGTIASPIPVEPQVTAGELALPVVLNRQPTPEHISVITRRYSSETRTPPGTVEYLLSEAGGSTGSRTLVPLDRREGSGPLPVGTVALAANGPDAIAEAEAWWAGAIDANQATFDTGLNGIKDIVGGSPLLLQGSAYGFPTGDSDGRHARTIIGWDTEKVWLATVDGGRTGWSTGVTYVEAAQMMRWLGATDALNLDGGSSTSFVGFGTLRSWPSLGTQKAVAAALVIMPPENAVSPPPPARPLDPACPPERVPANPFADAGDSVHTGAIACAAWWGITTGVRPSVYEPLLPVRRDQMASFLARYLRSSGVAMPANPPDAFPDDDGLVHEPAINSLTALGVIAGSTDGRYGPAGAVTRAQMATFLARSIGLVTGTPLPHVADYFNDDSGNVHEPAINQVTEAAVAGGTAEGEYRPGAPVRRDQMASFLARALTMSVAAGKAAPPG
jgi:hypothetical protein